MNEEARFPDTNLSLEQTESERPKIYKYLIISMMILIVLIIGIFIVNLAFKQTGGVKDCGENLKCFIKIK